MSTLQRAELLTQSEILEKETSPPVKEAYDEAKHGQDLYQNGGEMAASYVIDFTVGWSFGEPQRQRNPFIGIHRCGAIVLWGHLVVLASRLRRADGVIGEISPHFFQVACFLLQVQE
jgi:hypothetical protein